MPKKFIILFLVTLLLMIFSLPAYAAYPSQCATGNAPGAQTGCTNDYDNQILSEQCMATYAQTYCSSMPDYLNRMASECAQLDPQSGINCNMIAQNGIYGREAAAYANYIESNASYNGSNTGTNAATTPASGMANFPTEFGLPDPAGGIKGILTTFLNWLLGIIGIIALIAFAVSGIQYFMAAGSEKTIETAKRNMMYSIIGVIVALSGFVVIQAVDHMLNASLETGTGGGGAPVPRSTFSVPTSSVPMPTAPQPTPSHQPPVPDQAGYGM